MLQVETPVATLFTLPTVSALAEHLADLSFENQPVLPVATVTKAEQLPLTPAQWRTWFLDQFEPANRTTTFPHCCGCKGRSITTRSSKVSLRYTAARKLCGPFSRLKMGIRCKLFAKREKCSCRSVIFPICRSRNGKRALSLRLPGSRQAVCDVAPGAASAPHAPQRRRAFASRRHARRSPVTAISTRVLAEELIALYGGFARHIR